MKLSATSKDTLKHWESELLTDYTNIKAKQLQLDLTRGKPSSEQLSLSNTLDGILQGNYISPSGLDVRNYGELEGIPEARQLGADILEVPANNVFAAGNSSLTLMHNVANIAHFYGLLDDQSAWKHAGKVKFLCPVPGYDRHFSICEQMGIEMLTVPMTAHGPDMDQVETMLKADPGIKGMWCVPKYSNPTGVTYSDECVTRVAQLANLTGENFRVFWDNAYAIHDLAQPTTRLANIYDACVTAGTEDSVIQFASTSKITFAGAGVSFLAASPANLNGLKQAMSQMTIGPDKVNQLRHVKFFQQAGSLQAHMRKHAEIIRPRFDCVLKHLENAFADNDMGDWERPDGGYFISFDTLPGLAKKVVALAADAGVKLTPAGATFPYNKDPQDKNIRIAPTVPSVENVDAAMQVFVTCVKLASVQQALENG